MKYLLTLPLLSSCSFLEALSSAVTDPTTAERAADAVTGAGQVATGIATYNPELVGAGIASVLIALGIIGKKKLAARKSAGKPPAKKP